MMSRRVARLVQPGVHGHEGLAEAVLQEARAPHRFPERRVDPASAVAQFQAASAEAVVRPAGAWGEDRGVERTGSLSPAASNCGDGTHHFWYVWRRRQDAP